ncbi:hypothetical protein [Streptomyces sp. DSM 40750]|uniref:hypothetical protein n=1 Tax=Streptomyces sp. DSM 40750 TaxID=2801030 RepID=UPI00214B680E|nr:hypothetical protein [Streptomyces sp. DSM 40750]UUU23655.1 hypothetical protein JIX55_27230 [Streptomyces sp. DSM 40750]
MPKSPEKNSGTTQYSADLLREYRTSHGYLPGMRDESREASDELAYYKSDPLRAGSTNFPPAANLMTQLTKVCEAFTNEFTFNFDITDTMIVTLADTGDAMEQAEEHGTLAGGQFGKLVGQAINARNGGGGGGSGPGSGSNNPPNTAT